MKKNFITIFFLLSISSTFAQKTMHYSFYLPSDSMSVVVLFDTLHPVNKKISTKIPKGGSFISQEQQGHLSNSHYVVPSRVAMKMEFSKLIQIPNLNGKKKVIINQIDFSQVRDSLKLDHYLGWEENVSGKFLMEARYQSLLESFCLDKKLSQKNESNQLATSKDNINLDIYVDKFRFSQPHKEYAKSEITLTFILSDIYMNTVDSISYTIKSDHFRPSMKSEATLKLLTKGICQMINDKKKLPYFEQYSSVQREMEKITLPINSKSSNNLLSALNSTCTVITDKGHGSGCFVSSEGHLITNYHVVKNASGTIWVITNSNDSINARILRFSPESDLALLKVDTILSDFYKLANTPVELGEDVVVIGTPLDTLLRNSISKGIISARSTIGKINYIQTDAKINAGNSGGALISADFLLIGIVNAKVVGFEVEGIGFAIPISEIFDTLNVTTIQSN